MAISADGECWFLVNASPDLRQQINSQPALHPQSGLRSSPIAAIVLTNGDVDAVAGLLHLRERTPFVIYAHPRILGVLDDNPIFRVLAPDIVSRRELELDRSVDLCGPDGKDSGLRLECFAVPGKVALYLETEESGPGLGTEPGDTLGLTFYDAGNGRKVVYIANCAMVNDVVKQRATDADVLFFDGTLWRDDELILKKEGTKTGQRMGHVSMFGSNGSMAGLADIEIGRRVFIHINNTNPALLADSVERRLLADKGWEVAYDGMEIVL